MDAVAFASLYADLRLIIDECIVIELAVLCESQILVITAEAYSAPSFAVRNYVIVDSDTRHLEQRIVIRAVLRCNLNSDIASVNEIVENLNILSAIQPLGEGSSFLDLEDYIVSNYLLPLGALVFVLFCTRRIGWGWENFKNEANKGDGLKVQDWMRPFVTWVLPALIIVVFIMGII